MRYIDLQTWPRRKHFKLFNAMGNPHFSMCANVDLSAFYPAIKQHGISLSIAMVYLLAKVANTIPEFRYRIRNEEIVEHEIVHPSTTILTDENLFSFCTIKYTEDFSSFARRATKQIAHVKQHLTTEDEAGQDDLLYMTAIPWVSFTSFMHPIDLNPVDSVPRFAWGKFFEDDGRMQMPLSVQAHHALMDGIHFGMFYEAIQDYLQKPEWIFDRG